MSCARPQPLGCKTQPCEGEQRDLDSESETCERGALATRLPLLGEESAGAGAWREAELLGVWGCVCVGGGGSPAEKGGQEVRAAECPLELGQARAGP